LLTDVLSSKEKDCCINPQSCEIWTLNNASYVAPRTLHIIVSSTV
jgi:hypothetical protein